MLANYSNDVQSGSLAPDVHLRNTAKLELVDFIAQQLPRWRDHPDRSKEQAETKLTETLCDHLNSATYYSTEWSHVQFRTETGDETYGARKIDLTVKPRAAVLIIEGRRHSQFDALFPIECKRLPTPKDKNRDEREYVITKGGTTGGIQRFKFGYHGATHEFGAMIAYVQEQTFDDWVVRVNDWIRSLAAKDSVWNNSDVLESTKEDTSGRTRTLKSRHGRTDNLGECELRHVWVYMN